jgi:amino acid transporter
VASVHAQFRTPYHAIAIQTLLVALLAATGTFERLLIIANGSVLLVYVACCLATAELRRRDVRAGGIPFRVPGANIVPWLALAVIVALLTQLQPGEWLALSGVVALAAAVYLVARPRRPSPLADPVGD